VSSSVLRFAVAAMAVYRRPRPDRETFLACFFCFALLSQ